MFARKFKRLKFFIMKKVLLSVAVVAAFGLTSCGGSDVCECLDKVAEAKSPEDIGEDCINTLKEADESALEDCAKEEDGDKDEE